MTKDELILAINNKTAYSGSYNSEENYFEITWDGSMAAGFPYEAKTLDDVEQDFANQSADDIFTLLCLINRYVNTPIDQRNWVGAQEYNFGQLRKKLKDMSYQTEQALTGCHMDPSAGPTYELPEHGVIITLDNGQKRHGERPYNALDLAEFDDAVVDFDNFIIPTRIIRSIQKCGDGDD